MCLTAARKWGLNNKQRFNTSIYGSYYLNNGGLENDGLLHKHAVLCDYSVCTSTLTFRSW